MHDPEVRMPATSRSSNLVAQSKALEAAGIALSLVTRAPCAHPITDHHRRPAAGAR